MYHLVMIDDDVNAEAVIRTYAVKHPAEVEADKCRVAANTIGCNRRYEVRKEQEP